MQGWEEHVVLVTVKLTQHNLHPTFHTSTTAVALSFPEFFLYQKVSNSSLYPLNFSNEVGVLSFVLL